MQPNFDWIPFYQEVSNKLISYEDNSMALVELLIQIGISGLEDEDAPGGQKVPLTEIDPFSFFNAFNKFGERKRSYYFAELARVWDLQETVPTAFSGVPKSNAQNFWCFGYRYVRQPQDIPNLWKLFKQALQGALDAQLFDTCLQARAMGNARITQALFIVHPAAFLPIDKQTVPYLKERGITTTFSDFRGYESILQQVNQRIPLDYHELSHRAYIASTLPTSSTPPSNPPKKASKVKTAPLNTILFGPPGTGKTYHSIDKALQLVDPLFYENNKQSRSRLQERFNDLLITDWESSKGQIAFCTFHQSFSYEDFIEGIKPEKPQQGDTHLKYNIKDGIFKLLCRKAETNQRLVEEKPQEALNLSKGEFAQASFYKMSLGDSTDPEDQEIFDYCMENNLAAIGFAGDVDFAGMSETEVTQTCASHDLDKYAGQAINYFKNYIKIGSYILVSNGNYRIRAIGVVTGDYYYNPHSPLRYNHFRDVKWLIKHADVPIELIYDKTLSMRTVYNLRKDGIIEDFFVKGASAAPEEEAEELEKNYVIIIDEINRGNISQIFGELITLIEESKRAGEQEALHVTLPYSKERFTVPQNVYILGTMNTADRSVEALDTALRRRFSFIEMPPQEGLLAPHLMLWRLWEKHAALDWNDPLWTEQEKNLLQLLDGHIVDKKGYRELEALALEEAKDMDVFTGIVEFKGLNLRALLGVINQRIQKLLDKDHLIGHSYFMDVNSWQDLKVVFQNKILPLLQEYFYGDLSKIGLVLGKLFFNEPNKEQHVDDSFFADFQHDALDDLRSREVWQLQDVLSMSDADFQTAVSSIFPKGSINAS